MRARAEALAAASQMDAADLSPAQLRKLVHELRVHQIELEMQNEELLRIQQDLDRSREHFLNLFHKAPIGYLVLDAAGVIRQANDAFARMADLDADRIIDRALADFIAPPDDGIFRSRYRSIFKNPENKFLEARIQCEGGASFIARIQGAVMTGPFSRLAGRDETVLLTITDVTEIREAEARYRTLFNVSPDAIFVIDSERRILDANDTAERRYGYRREELLAMRVDDLAVSKLKSLAPERVRQAMAAGVQFAWQHRRSDGSELPVEISASPFVQDGRRYVITCARDLSESQEIEKSLRKRENLLSRIFDILPVGLWFADKNGTLLRGNPKGIEIWGAEPRVGIAEYGVFKARRLPSGTEIAPDDWALAHTISKKITVLDELLEIDALDGRKKVILNYTAPILDEAGDVEGAVVVNLDITDRMRAEAALAASRNELQAIYDAAPIMMCVLDDRHRVLYANRALMDFTGKSEDDLKSGRACGVFGCVGSLDDPRGCGFGPQCETCALNLAIRDTLQTGESRSGIEYRSTLVNQDNPRDVVLMGSTALIQAEGEARLLLCLEDITDRDRLKSQLFQAQKMESIGRLAGGVAHDFNNLLSVILGYSEMTLDDMGEGHPALDAIREIHAAGLRARDLTRQLLAFARRQVLDTRTVDLSRIVAGFEKFLRRIIGEDIALELALADAPLPVRADLSQMEQTLMNLAVNARDAMPGGGILTIETHLIHVTAADAEKRPGVQAGPFAVMAVSDTGIGMDARTQENIFEPFFTTKGKDKGTGLGLSTVFGIVKQHGGNIWVYSEPGRGSTFKIYLPLANEAVDTALPSAAVVSPQGGSATVLVVEDDPQVRSLACIILSQNGYTVIESQSPEDAVSRAFRHASPIDLVLTDVIMPGLKGPEVYERVRRSHPEAKVLYMSGYTENAISHKGVLMEGIAFIQKPLSIKGLLDKAAEVLAAGDPKKR